MNVKMILVFEAKTPGDLRPHERDSDLLSPQRRARSRRWAGIRPPERPDLAPRPGRWRSGVENRGHLGAIRLMKAQPLLATVFPMILLLPIALLGVVQSATSLGPRLSHCAIGRSKTPAECGTFG